MKEIYGIDMEANGQYSKLIADIPDVDIAISMGCNVGCPFIGRALMITGDLMIQRGNQMMISRL